MSIDISWEALTGGTDGGARAEAIRAFIHDRFQQVTLPRFIRSVHVHSFDFGSVPPEIEIKDICDPLPDFYEEDEDYPDEQEDDGEAHDSQHEPSDPSSRTAKERRLKGTDRGLSYVDSHHPEQSRPEPSRLAPPYVNSRVPGLRTTLAPVEQLGSPFLPRASTPGIPGGTSNINYFHLPLSAGLSGATTPLAAVAGAQLQGWPDNYHGRPSTPTEMRLRTAASIGSLTLTPQSNPDPSTRPSSQHQHDVSRRNSVAESAASSENGYDRTPSVSPTRMREKSPEDVQVVAHVQYSGDVKMSLTAEILLDYPMPSFVGIPLKLNITGLTFDGVAILAYIKKRAHFCFLSPDDAEALIGGESNLDALQTDTQLGKQNAPRPRVGGLLEQIKVESEIGEKLNGKQVLKNVGKVESFVLEQVRRIFEDEFVYPSFWTFLV
jgi:mitochondrial distribution and morphology protein 12